MTSILLWILITIILGSIFFREVLRLQEAKREKDNPAKDFKRFRRRVKGLFVLLLIFATIQTGHLIEPYLNPRQILIYYLNCFIELIWLLILVGREFTDITASYITLRQEVTMDALKEIQKEVTAKKADPDDEAIPGFDFRNKS